LQDLFASVIVDNFNVAGISIFPYETHSPLIIDPDAVLPFAVAFQAFKSVAWWDPQIAQFNGAVQHYKLSVCCPVQFLLQQLRMLATHNSGSMLACK